MAEFARAALAYLCMDPIKLTKFYIVTFATATLAPKLLAYQEVLLK